jgi:polyhydroxyalkanoate synthesis regulator phasin
VPNAKEQYLQALASLTELTRSQAERISSRLARQGELQSAQVSRFAEDLVRRTQKNREAMNRMVQREVKRQLGMVGIATRDEVARLHQRVRALEQALERAESKGASRPRSTRVARGSSGRGAAAGKEKVSPASAGTRATSRTSAAGSRSTTKRAATAKRAGDATTRGSGTSTQSSASSGRTTRGRSSDAS